MSLDEYQTVRAIASGVREMHSALEQAREALLAGARERDALRAIVERLSADLDTMHAGRTEARALVASLEAQVEDLRALCREAAGWVRDAHETIAEDCAGGIDEEDDRAALRLIARLRAAGGES